MRQHAKMRALYLAAGTRTEGDGYRGGIEGFDVQAPPPAADMWNVEEMREQVWAQGAHGCRDREGVTMRADSTHCGLCSVGRFIRM